MRAVDPVIEALGEFKGPTSNWIVGEPCFPPPVELREALSHAAHSRSYRYPPPAGLPELRDVLASLTCVEEGIPSRENVVVTHGAKGGLFALFATILHPGDEIIHPQPCYPAYVSMAETLGARPVAVPESRRGFKSWTDAIRPRINERTRAVVLASPSNPTGSTLHREEARLLVELCRENDIRLICDEAYVDFRFAEDTQDLPATFDPNNATVVQVRSASKSWALCGWRLGWLIADRDLAERVALRQASLLNPASGPAQEALLSLPRVDTDFADAARTAVGRRHTEVREALGSSLGILEPDGGFYLWFKIDGRNDGPGSRSSTDWCRDLARRTGVGLWPGEDFLGPGWVRLAVTSPPDDVWNQSLERLVAALG